MKGLKLKRVSRRGTTDEQLAYLSGLIDNSGENSIILRDDGDVWLNIFSKSIGHIENVLWFVLHLDYDDAHVREYRSGSARLQIVEQYLVVPLVRALQPYLIVKRQVVEDYLRRHNRSVRAPAPLSSTYVAGVFDSRSAHCYWNYVFKAGWKYRFKNIYFTSSDVDYLWRISRFVQAGNISVDKEKGSNVRDLFTLNKDIFQLRISNAFHIQRVADEILLPHSTHPERRDFLTEERGEKEWVGLRSARADKDVFIDV